MIRTQIQLEAEDFARLQKEAARRSCSVSAFVRESVKAALNDSNHAAGLSAVREIAGKYHSGKGELSRNHDTYLENGW